MIKRSCFWFLFCKPHIGIQIIIDDNILTPAYNDIYISISWPLLLRTYHKFQTDSTQCTKITNIWMASLICHTERRSTLYAGTSSSSYSQEEISRYSRIEDQREAIDYHLLGRRQPNSIETSRTHLVPISSSQPVLYGLLLGSIKAEANHLEVNPIPPYSFLCHPYR